MTEFRYNRSEAVRLIETIDGHCEYILSEAQFLLSLMNHGHWRDDKRKEFNEEISDNYDYIVKSIEVLVACSEELKRGVAVMDS